MKCNYFYLITKVWFLPILNIKIFNDYLPNFGFKDSLDFIGILKSAPQLAWIFERQQQRYWLESLVDDGIYLKQVLRI